MKWKNVEAFQYLVISLVSLCVSLLFMSEASAVLGVDDMTTRVQDKVKQETSALPK